MKTESTKKEQRNANIQSGVSSAVGAGIGVAAAMSAESVFAAEESGVEVIAATPTRPTNIVVEQPTTNQSEEEVVIPLDSQEEEIAEESTEEPIVEVAQEQDQDLEIVEVTIGGTSYSFADVDSDGVADVVTVDLNNNGQVDLGEAVNVSQEGFLMADVSELGQQDSASMAQVEDVDVANGVDDNLFADHLAYNDSGVMPDYTNDADVNEFMA